MNKRAASAAVFSRAASNATTLVRSLNQLACDNALDVFWREELGNRHRARPCAEESVGLGLIAAQSVQQLPHLRWGRFGKICKLDRELVHRHNGQIARLLIVGECFGEWA